MAINAATFVDRYPEFTEILTEAPDMINRVLVDAQTFVSAKRFGTRYEGAVYCKAAHLLAMTPFGENARLASDKTSSCYEVVFQQMVRALPVRAIVAGLDD